MKNIILTTLAFILLPIFITVYGQDLHFNQLINQEKIEKEKSIERFERSEFRPFNFEFYVNFGHMFLTNDLRKNLKTYFEVPLGVSFGYENITLNFQYNLVFGNVDEPFEYKEVLMNEKTSYAMLNLSASLGYRFIISPKFSFVPKAGIISSNLKGLNEEYDENPIDYPTLKSNAPVFILNFDFDGLTEEDRTERFDDPLIKKRRNYSLFTRLQFLYSTPNYYRKSEMMGQGSIFMVSLGFGLHRHFMK